MEKKGFIILWVSSGIIIILLIFSKIIFKVYPFANGYTYSGTGKIITEVDIDKLKKVSAIFEGESGRAFIDLLKLQVSSMQGDMTFYGAAKEKEELYVVKITGNEMPELESKYYSDGEKKWMYSSPPDNKGEWHIVETNDSIDNIIASIDIENFDKLKEYIYLKSQDENSSTFFIVITDKNEQLFLGPEVHKALESMSGGGDFKDFVNSMKINLDIKTAEKVDDFTPYVKVTGVDVHFILPMSSLDTITGKKSEEEFGTEEKKIMDSIYMKVSLNLHLSYDDVTVERPEEIK